MLNGTSSVILEGDFRDCHQSFEKQRECFTTFGHLIYEAKLLFEAFCLISFSHVKRLGKSMTHNLTRYANHITSLSVWMKDVPSQLNALLIINYG